MASNTDFFNLQLPDRGEFPGTWDIPVNSNWELIDTILKNLHTNRASNDEPETFIDDGSTWYEIATSLLKVKTVNGFEPVVKHIHDGSTEGVPQINLSRDILEDTNYKLAGFMVDTAGNNADKLDGYHLSEIPGQIAGDGLADDGNGGLKLSNIASIEAIAAPEQTIEFTKVTVDVKGRVVSGSKPNTIAGYGITDVFTKTEAQNYFASIKGSVNNLFQIKDPADGVVDGQVPDITKCAISRAFGDLRYAPIVHNHNGVYSLIGHTHSDSYHPMNGSSQEELTTKDPLTNDPQYDSWVFTRIYGDNRYKVPFENHLTQNGGHLYLNGGTMTGEIVLDRDTAPTSDRGATSKAYVLSLLSLKAPSVGNAAQSFLVAKAPASPDPDFQKYALNILRANELYSTVNHAHDGVYTSSHSALKNAQENIKSIISSTRNILTSKLSASFLTYAGLNLTINADATDSGKLTASISDGYINGSDNNISAVIEEDKTIAIANQAGIHYVFVEAVKYNTSFDVSGTYNIGDSIVTLTQQVGSDVLLSDIPKIGQISFSEEGSRKYEFEYINPDLTPGILYLTEPIEVGFTGGTADIYDITGNILIKTIKLEPYETTYEPVYSTNSPTAATGKMWYDTNAQVFKKYDGAEWDITPAICIGTATVSGGNIIAVSDYSVGSKVPIVQEISGIKKAYLSTTDNTQTTIVSIGIDAEDAIVFNGIIIGVKDDTTQVYAAEFKGFAKNDGGTTTINTPSITAMTDNNLAASFTFAANDTVDSVDFKVTGIAATNIDWKIKINYI